MVHGESPDKEQSLIGLRNLNKIVHSYHINNLPAFMGSRYPRLSDNFPYTNILIIFVLSWLADT